MVWQIQLIRHLMLKITPHTTQIFNIKYLLIELAKPYLGQKYILKQKKIVYLLQFNVQVE